MTDTRTSNGRRAESQKYPRPEESTSEAEAKMAAQLQANAIGLVLIALVVFVAVTSLPISPSLGVTFQITTSQVYPNVAINVLQPSYQKVSFLTYWGTSRDMLTLSPVSAQTGDFIITASVTYAEMTVSAPVRFTDLGAGTYQLKVTYFPRTEQQGTPYVIGLQLTAYGQTTSYLVNVYPI